MGLTGDRYIGTYEGHTIELIRNNWTKRLKLLIDGEVVASKSCDLPRNITLMAVLEHDGIPHAVQVPYPQNLLEQGQHRSG